MKLKARLKKLKMIKKIVNKLIDELLQNKIIKPEEKPLYEYGLELTIVSLLNSIWIIGVGMILDCLILSVVYILILGSVRTQIGGYHAKSYVSCFLCYNIFFAISYLFCKVLIVFNLSKKTIIMVGCIYILIIYLFAPVTRRRILNKSKKRQARNKAIYLTIFWIFTSVTMRYSFEYYSYSIVIILGISIILMLMEKIFRGKRM